MARAMDSGYSGPRPRVELWHGTADSIISYVNQTEAIKQWTNVLSLSSTPTSTTTVTIGSNQYTHQAWLDSLGNTVLDAWSETGGGHGTDALFNANYVIPFLNLNRVGSGALSGAQDSDIGSPSPAGSSSYNADTDIYTVAGGGAAIGGTSDQFHYLSQGITGDGSIVARVTGVQNTSTGAKAGVMFRDSTAAGAMFADMVVTAGQGLDFQWRSSTGGTAGSVQVSGITAPAWVKLVRSGNGFTAFYATTTGTPTASDWIQVGTAQTIAMSSTAQAGLAVTSNNNGTLCTSTFTAVQLQSLGIFGSSLDIGSPSPAGSGIYDAGTDTYTVAGGGADIWGTSDQFHYFSKSFTGNGSITARVNSETSTTQSAKTGVMFRNSTAANAAYAFAWVSPGNNVGFETRASNGASSSYSFTVSAGTSPVWVRSDPLRQLQQSVHRPVLARRRHLDADRHDADGHHGRQCSGRLGGDQSQQRHTVYGDNRPRFVGNAAPIIATAASASPSTTGGTVASLSVLGADDGGESNLTYTWSLTGTPPAPVAFSVNGSNAAKNTTTTFSKAGIYNFTVAITDQGGLSTTSGSVSVTVNQTLTGIAVTPGTANLVLGGTQQFSAVAFDQFGNAMAAQPTFTWGLASGAGSINSSGLYTASAAGSASVQATSGGISGTASVAVVTGYAVPTVAKAASASPAPVAGTSTTLSVLGADDGGESNLTYTWSLTGTPPAPVTFSANGTNAAKNTTVTFTAAGVYNFTVTITDQNGLSTTSSVAMQVSFGSFTNSSDIGSPALAGSLDFDISSTAYTVTAGGANVGGTSDQFRYTYEAFNGNGQFTARVTSVSNTNSIRQGGR